MDSTLALHAEFALKQGDFEVRFNDENYVIVKERDYKALVEKCRQMDSALTQNLIEKEIAKEMPKDFDDVFIVAKSMLNEHPNVAEIRRAVREIKMRYPNLFVDINDYFKNVMEIDD